MSNTETEERETPESLRAAAEAGRKSMQENAELRKELLFTRAAIDTSKGVGKLLFKNWDGDDLEELKAEATELGLYADTPRGQDAPDPQDLEVDQTRSVLRGGTPSGSTPEMTPHPVDTALAEYQADLKNGVRVDEARLAVVDKWITAGVAGDKRVLFDQNEWAEKQRAAGHGRA